MARVNKSINNINGLTTVEVYDHLRDRWSPRMIERRRGHSLVAIRNKLFVVGGTDQQGHKPCEVMDSSDKFV